MGKIEDAKKILKEMGMPEQQQTDIAAYSLLTLTNIKPKDKWNIAKNEWIRIHDVLQFSSCYYGKTYAENTRETIRKSCMHQFREAALIEDNGKATNSPHYCYRITNEAIALIRTFGTTEWKSALQSFKDVHSTLIEKYASKKRMEMMPVCINGEKLQFSPGKHNALQRAIIEQFAPRFAPNCECLYVGDTIKKDLPFQ